MGEAKKKLSATERLIAQYPWCYFCGGQRPAKTRDHVPPKAMFDNSHRPSGLEMPCCDECNRSTSTADLMASIISRWTFRDNALAMNDHGKLVHQLFKQEPDIIKEITSVAGVRRKKARRELIAKGVPLTADAGIARIGPKTILQLNIFAHKAVLAMHFEQFREPLASSGRIFATWRAKEDVVVDGIPEELLNIMPRYAKLSQGRWDEAKTFEYRYDKNTDDGIFGCLLRMRRNFLVIGFTMKDASIYPDAGREWIAPDITTQLFSNARFSKRV